MTEKLKKICILTSGGDSPGMNAAVRALARYGISKGLDIFLVLDGYSGILNDKIIKCPKLEKLDTMLRYGGTFIHTVRFPEFENLEIQKQAAKKLIDLGITALIVIGGDGSFKGADALTKLGINCIGLPGTIDNDIVSSQMTIGFDTCVNTATDAIENIIDTMRSHYRCGIVEVMGRNCGDIALLSGTAAGADLIITSETAMSSEEIIENVKTQLKLGKKSLVIVTSENLYDVHDLAKEIEKNCIIETRATILGHIQRGGKPTAFDRYLATILSIEAIDQLVKGNGGLCIGLLNGKVQAIEINNALKLPRDDFSKITKKINKINSIYKK